MIPGHARIRGTLCASGVPVEELKEKYLQPGIFWQWSPALDVAIRYRFKRLYNHYADNPVHDLIAPASLAGINHSDHLAFYRAGIPALMISDTGPIATAIITTRATATKQSISGF
jgi:hypothetical protein